MPTLCLFFAVQWVGLQSVIVLVAFLGNYHFETIIIVDENTIVLQYT